MAKVKFCPLSFNSPSGFNLLKCKRKECAWWEEVNKICVVQTLAIAGLSMFFGKEKEEEFLHGNKKAKDNVTGVISAEKGGKKWQK